MIGEKKLNLITNPKIFKSLAENEFSKKKLLLEFLIKFQSIEVIKNYCKDMNKLNIDLFLNLAARRIVVECNMDWKYMNLENLKILTLEFACFFNTGTCDFKYCPKIFHWFLKEKKLILQRLEVTFEDLKSFGLVIENSLVVFTSIKDKIDYFGFKHFVPMIEENEKIVF